jgi:hypothetical protein
MADERSGNVAFLTKNPHSTSARATVNPVTASGVVAALVAIFLAGFLASRFVSARLRSHRTRARLARAKRGERQAADLLERLGYRIEGREVETEYAIRVGSASRRVLLRADYVVSRASRRFVAEVKTGQAADVDVSSTRRQLLEYERAFAVDGVLLVDPENDRIDRVDFRFRRERAVLRVAVLAFALGLAVAFVLLR